MKAAPFKKKRGMPFLQAIKPTLRALAGLGLYGERRAARCAEIAAATGNAADLEGENLNAAAAAAWHQFAETSDGRYRCRCSGESEGNRFSRGNQIDRRGSGAQNRIRRGRAWLKERGRSPSRRPEAAD